MRIYIWDLKSFHVFQSTLKFAWNKTKLTLVSHVKFFVETSTKSRLQSESIWRQIWAPKWKKNCTVSLAGKCVVIVLSCRFSFLVAEPKVGLRQEWPQHTQKLWWNSFRDLETECLILWQHKKKNKVPFDVRGFNIFLVSRFQNVKNSVQVGLLSMFHGTFIVKCRFC